MFGSKTTCFKCHADKSDSKDAPPDRKEKPPTKITDLNDDCLLKIFGHLDLVNLFSVAVANEYLRPAAGEIYRQKFGAKAVKVSECNDYKWTRANARKHQSEDFSSALDLSSYEVTVRGLKASLQFLRCFGSEIKRLYIHFEKSASKRYQHLLQQVNNFCSGNLERLTFYEMPDMAIEQQFKKRFSKVIVVTFKYGCLGQQWPSIMVEYFPNIKVLNMIHVSICCRANKNSIEKPIKTLKEIYISGGLTGDKALEIAANLLANARQLNSFTISSRRNADMNKLLTEIKNNPSIVQLILSHNYPSVTIRVNSNQVRQLLDQHSKLIFLRLYGYELNADEAVAVIRGLKSLKIFQFHMLPANYSQFIKQLDTRKWNVKNRQLYKQRYYDVELKC